jgi:membrane associated rhomboid family serine protease
VAGASGAVFGLMGALLVLAFKVGGQVQPILVWIGINAVLTFTFGFSWQGHLGGFLGGVAIAAVLVYSPRQRRAQYQAAGLTAIGLAIAGAIVAGIVSLT